LPFVDAVDGMALALERRLKQASHRRLVFDHEQPHGTSPSGACGRDTELDRCKLMQLRIESLLYSVEV